MNATTRWPWLDRDVEYGLAVRLGKGTKTEPDARSEGGMRRTTPVPWRITADNVRGIIGSSRDGTGTKTIRVPEDRSDAPGDIGRVPEPGVVEPFPTHPVLVAEEPDPSKGTMATIEGDSFDRVRKRRHRVTRNTRGIPKHPHC